MNWEYKVLDIDTKGIVEMHLDWKQASSKLNELGREGWELVSVTGVSSQQGWTSSSIFVFKRPLDRT